MREYAESLTYATAQTISIGGVTTRICARQFLVPIEIMEVLEALGGQPMARDPDRRVSIAPAAPQTTRSFSDSTLGAADALPPPVTVRADRPRGVERRAELKMP